MDIQNKGPATFIISNIAQKITVESRNKSSDILVLQQIAIGDVLKIKSSRRFIIDVSISGVFKGMKGRGWENEIF